MPSSACTSPPSIQTLSLHDALPILRRNGDIFLRMNRLSVFAEATADRSAFPRPFAMANTSALVRRPPLPVPGTFSGSSFSSSTTRRDRKSTRLNSSHRCISYAVFCLHVAPLDPDSFPTRRSSDLAAQRRHFLADEPAIRLRRGHGGQVGFPTSFRHG